MSDWCPENDGAYRSEMAAISPDLDRKRIEELELKLKQAYINIRDYSSDPALVAWAKVNLKSL